MTALIAVSVAWWVDRRGESVNDVGLSFFDGVWKIDDVEGEFVIDAQRQSVDYHGLHNEIDDAVAFGDSYMIILRYRSTTNPGGFSYHLMVLQRINDNTVAVRQSGMTTSFLIRRASTK